MIRDAEAPDRCPACEALTFTVLRTGCRDRLLGLPGQWRVVRCDACALCFTTPRLTEAQLLEYYPATYPVYQSRRPIRHSRLGARLRAAAMAPYRWRFGDPDGVPPPFGHGRFLDVGCGSGGQLKHFSDAGWTVTGLDVSPTAIAAAARRVPNATLRTGTLATFESPDRFDIISMCHVLEHLPDPGETLTRCRELLAPGGRLLVNVPNIESWEARLFGDSWMAFDVARHCSHFSPSTLAALLEARGFDVERMRPAMIPSTLSESLIMLLPGAYRRQALSSKAARLLYFSLVLPASITYLLGNCPAVDVVAVRR